MTTSADFKYAPSLEITIPSEQTPSSDSYDSVADVMVAKSDAYSGIPQEEGKNGSISLKWNRLVAHGHFTLKNLPVEDKEVVKSIVITADNDADMVGKHNINFDTELVEKVGDALTNSIKIDGTNLAFDDKGNVTFWVCFLPCTWQSISVKVETDKASYSLERNLAELGNTKTFAKNARNVLAINMGDASREIKTSASLPFVVDFSDMTGNTEISQLEGFSSISGKVYYAKGAIRLASGSADGLITTKLLDLSQNFHVKVFASGWDSDELSLSVSTSEQEETVKLTTYGTSSEVGAFTEHIVNFKPVSNSSTVTFKAIKGIRCHIQKIEINEGHATLVPILSATTPSEISAKGGTSEFQYTITNPIDGQKVISTSNVSWISNLKVDNGKVTYDVAENTSNEKRTGVITLEYEGAVSVEVTITQAGKPAEGETVEAWTLVTDASSLAVGDKIVIVASTSDYAMGADKGNNREAVSIKKSGNTVIITDEVQIITLEKGNVSNTFAFNTGAGYLYAASSSSNYLKTNTALDDNGSWTITIDSNGVSTIKSQGTSTRNWIRKNSSSALFACYASGQYDVSIYKLVGNAGGETPEPEEPETPVEPEQPTLSPRNLAFSPATATATMGQPFTAPTLSGVTTGVTYSSSNTSVATVDDSGVVTLVSAGATTITASAPATDQYEAGEATYTLTVNAAQTVVSKSATITFGSNNVKISSASATGKDTQQNNWTITTTGTTSFTSNSAYYQVGSSKAPASTITFTTTLPLNASVSKISAKFGGFSGTAGTVTMKVGDTSIGSGKLNATTDVVVNSTSTASGNVVTVTVSSIDKGVKCYYITVDYTD